MGIKKLDSQIKCYKNICNTILLLEPNKLVGVITVCDNITKTHWHVARFETAKMLAKKMTVLYKLSREQLSKQYHYDFGLRALKSVLVMAGAFKRGDAAMSEQLVLMRALRDMNLPKFTFEDVPLFLGLINDLFPGMDCPRVRYPSFNDVVEDDLKVCIPPSLPSLQFYVVP